MAGTYSQMYAHCVWAVKQRKPLIPTKFRQEIHRFFAAVVKNRGQKLIEVFCMPDHVHLIIGFRPNICISDVVRDVKRESSIYFREQNWITDKFEWQEGFGCFTCSHKELDAVCAYVRNQEEHHAKRDFEVEYMLLMKHFEVEYNERYLLG